MLKNYLKIALRQLSRNRAYSLINIVGLGVGLACFVLLTLFVRQEFNYDNYHANADRIYQAFFADTTREDTRHFYGGAFHNEASLIDSAVPEVVNTARLSEVLDKVVKLENNDRFFIPKMHLVDASLFEIFDIPLVQGGERPSQFSAKEMLISQSEANRLFASETEAMGKTVEIVESGKFVITGVFADMPANSHLEMDYIIPYSNAQEMVVAAFANLYGGKIQVNWDTYAKSSTYLLLDRSPEDLSPINEKINAAIATGVSKNRIAEIANVQDIYMSQIYHDSHGKRGDSKTVRLYLLIGLIILTLAIVNYVNMATARFSKRAKEVGVRRALGGFRSQLIRQFLAESMITSLISLIIGVCFAEMITPFFQNLVGQQFSIDYQQIENIGLLLGIGVITGFVAGVYPSLYMSRTNVTRLMNSGAEKGKGGMLFRKGLVTFQFLVCIALMICTWALYNQFNFMRNVEKGYESEQVLSFELHGGAMEKYEVLKQNLMSNPGIDWVFGSSFSIFDGGMSVSVDIEDSKESEMLGLMMTEDGFVENMGIELNEGRSFRSGENEEKVTGALINQAAIEKFGWESIEGKTLMGVKVIGVTKDFLYRSARNKIDPLLIMPSASGYTHAYVRINDASNIESIISFIETENDKFSQNYPFTFEFIDDVFARKYKREQDLSEVFSTFSILAILVAALGVLGLSMFMVEQRIKEIGIRKVLGASTSSIIWLLNANITKLIAIAGLMAVPLSHYIMSDWLSKFANRIELNAVLLVLPILVVVLVSWSILMYHSGKAANSNPVNALRSE